MKTIVFLITLLATASAMAQYQVDPTHLFPASSNTAPAKRTPPKNRVISTTDRQRAIPLHKADRFYAINQSKPISIKSNRRLSKTVTSWKNIKEPNYHSLYQDPSK